MPCEFGGLNLPITSYTAAVEIVSESVDLSFAADSFEAVVALYRGHA